MSFVSVGLLAVGYPPAIVVVSRFVPVIRQRRRRWFWAHQAAVGAIVAGWAIEGKAGAAAVNGAWLLVAAAWWARAGRMPDPA